ncbi:MAG: outer membrane beta-barrel protein [Gemmatimonadaceae bacterium]|nr:outer membrane beta-barrel protein [Gemmatimonadaceae bacterium]
MTSPRLLAMAACVLLAAPASLRAQRSASISVSGGVSAPMGRLGDATDLGYTVAAGVNVGGRSTPIGLRFEGAFNSFGYKRLNNSSVSGDIRILAGTANAVYNFSRAADSPYLIGGLGVYNRKVSAGTVSSDALTRAGINGGGGLRFPLSGLSTFFEARYHVMFNDDRDGTNYQFIPITFGITF